MLYVSFLIVSYNQITVTQTGNSLSILCHLIMNNSYEFIGIKTKLEGVTIQIKLRVPHGEHVDTFSTNNLTICFSCIEQCAKITSILKTRVHSEAHLFRELAKGYVLSLRKIRGSINCSPESKSHTRLKKKN